MSDKKVFCEHCHKDRKYSVKRETEKTIIAEKEIQYKAIKAICKKCGQEVYIQSFVDRNLRKVNEKYCEAAGLIQVNDIKKLCKKYGLDAINLAYLLDWKKDTVCRYLIGDIPTKEHSDKLLELIADPEKIVGILIEKNELSCTYCKFYNSKECCCMYKCAIMAILNEDETAKECSHFTLGEFNFDELEKTNYQ